MTPTTIARARAILLLVRILVTGGLGFIGANLCNKLLADGHDVVSLDVRSTSSAGEKLLKPGVDRLVSDVRHVIDYPWDKFDQVYHLACPASPPRYQADPLWTLETSFLGTRNVLQAAAQAGSRVLFTSTSEIYGDPQISPQSETYRGWVATDNKRSCYDEGKRVAETLCYEFRKRGVDVRTVRIFNTYGPGMDADDGRVISNFLTQAIRGEPLTVYGDGKQTRSFCYVDDMIEGLMKAMNSKSFEGAINLGNPDERPINEIADLVEDKVKRVGRIYKPLPEADPLQRRPDVTRAKTLLKWQPKTRLEDGLLQTLEWFREIS